MSNACNNVKVTNVTDYLTYNASSVFGDLFNDATIKLIVGLCHISTSSNEIDTIYTYFSKNFQNIPIVLLTGHSHLRNNTALPRNTSSLNDESSSVTANGFAFESGCYMKTIGYLTFELPLDTQSEAPNITFNYTYLDGTKPSLMNFLNISDLDDFESDVGDQMDYECWKEFIDLELDEFLGQSPQYYSENQSPSDGETTVFMLLANEFLPTYKSHYRDTEPSGTVNTLFAVSYSSVRSLFSLSLPVSLSFFFISGAIYEGYYLYDDLLTIDPFNNSLVTFTDLTGSIITNLAQDDTFSAKYYLTNTTLSDDSLYDLTCTTYDQTRISV